MSIEYGFELEGFFKQGEKIVIPPDHVPTDSFSGLVELRTVGGDALRDAWSKLAMLFYFTPQMDLLDTHVFSAEEMRQLRARILEVKYPILVQNIYGKTPRLISGGKRWASLQINLSNCRSVGYTDSKGNYFPPRYALLDIPAIVRRLDSAFADQIKAAKRVPGEYALKDNNTRLEYRSLPCSVALEPLTNPVRFLEPFLDKIEKAALGDNYE